MKKTKEIKPLNLTQCWTMVNRISNLEQCIIAEQWLLKAKITNDQYDELMHTVCYMYDELTHIPSHSYC